jgi:hypothetical protein
MRDPRFKIERRKQKLSILNIFLIFLFVRCIEYYILMPYLNISLTVLSAVQWALRLCSFTKS